MPLFGQYNRFSITLVLTIVLVVTGVYAQEAVILESARSAGMAGAYLAIGDDANAISSNSAGLSRLGRTQLVGSYTRFYTGKDIGSINEGSLLFSPYIWGKYFYGVGVSYFDHSIFRQQKATLVFGRELWRKRRDAKIAGGLNVNLYRVEYNSGNFSEDFDPNDPVFSGGYSKFAFGFDVNFLGEYGPLSLGLAAYNLLEPDISLRGGAESGQYPRNIRTGLSYDILGYVSPAVELEIPITSEPGVSDKLSYAFGAESWFINRMLGARAGYSSDFITIGVSFRTRLEWDIGFDYAIQLPLEAPGEIGQNHKVSAEIGMRKPTRVITDIIVEPQSVTAIPELVWSGDTAFVYATIKNVGDMTAKNFPVSVYYIDKGKSWVVAQTTIDKLEPGESRKISFAYAPTIKRYYELFVSANDYGDKAPAVHNKVLEYDYDNNAGTARLACFDSPVPAPPRTSRDELVISTVSRIREEVPMIPAVHFPRSSDDFNEWLYGPMLDVIAERLNKNPDVMLVLYGYYDEETESANGEDLAVKRSRAVKKYLLDHGVDPDRIRIVEEGYNMAYEREKEPLEKDRELIREENRVVELQVGLDETTALGKYYYEESELRPSREDRTDCRSAMQRVYSLLENNPELNVLFHGHSAPGEKNGATNAYIRAATFRGIAFEWIPDWLRRRVLLLSSEGEEERPYVDVYVTGDALVFKPRGSTLSSGGVEFSELGVTEITIDTVITETRIDSFAIIIREEGSAEPFAVLQAGSGPPPRSVEWNWFGSMGQAPDPTKDYFVEVFIKDMYDQTVTSMSDPIAVTVDAQEDRKELFLINFNFGKAAATSEYLEARVEDLAANLIERAKYLGPNARIRATVVGHTDIVGTDEFNENLAWERAKKEYENLRNGMMTILELETDEELDEWLRAHKVTLMYEGRGFEEPMFVHRFEQGYWRKELIGNNEIPLGRLVNRRVVLEVLTQTR